MTRLDDLWGPGTTSKLDDVSRLCQRAEQFAARGRQWYDSDPELGVPHLAADSIVLKIGEAVRRLPAELLESRRTDPVWRRAIGMRHRLAHQYDAIDYELVWQVVSAHAADLRASIQSMLAEDRTDQQRAAQI